MVKLYFTRFIGRERSSTRTFPVDTGIVHTTVNLVGISDTEKDIKPKSYTIDISFEDLGLILKGVRLYIFVNREGA